MVALAAGTMVLAPIALLRGAAGSAATASTTGSTAHAAVSSLGATQALAKDLPSPLATSVARHRAAVKHNQALRRAAAHRRHAHQLADARHSAARSRSSAAHWRMERHAAAVRHSEKVHEAALRRAARHRTSSHRRRAREAGTGHSKVGAATWYAWHPGECASPFLPHGTLLTVTDLATGKSIHCLVTDTEADNVGRVVDLSEQCFEELGPLSQGVIEVRVSW